MSFDIGKINPVTTTYKWTLEETYIKNKKNGAYIRSPIISLTDSKAYTIWLYPKGQMEEQKGHLSIYLQSVKGNFDVSFRFGVINGKNKLVNLKATKYSLQENKPGFGFPFFMKCEYLDEVNMMRTSSGCKTLTIVCELTLEPMDEEETVLKLEKDTRLKEFDELDELVDEEKFSDVTLAVEGKKLYAHKCILAKKSEVFAAMFTHNMKENERAYVDIDDVAYDVMREFLRYIYSGRVDNLEKMAMTLYKAADKYLIKNLKKICERQLIQNINAQNVLEYLNFASLFNVPALKQQSIDFLKSNAKDVARQSSFKLSNLDKYTIDQIFLVLADPE
ncbi:hypothetical protein QAD02_011016 [Eretmocerus hayati]|uniref:Uncharacterized protein n=1 Tax=Eretmocerus hayati TaxID=131215 RepID=A0ACC2NVK5_9HYME|nr:hypothetical protein QAD02_011016 [Eretmocerus hayati]